MFSALSNFDFVTKFAVKNQNKETRKFMEAFEKVAAECRSESTWEFLQKLRKYNIAGTKKSTVLGEFHENSIYNEDPHHHHHII